MHKKSFFFLVIFFIFCLIVNFSKEPWFIYFPKENLFIIASICAVLQILFSFFKNGQVDEPKQFLIINENFLIILMLSISFFSMVSLPVRNLNLGDGILLLEHVALEAKVFGFHLTMDEVMEALIHSVIFSKFQSTFETPMDVYRLLSTFFGLVSLTVLYIYFRKFKVKLFGYFIVISSGGMYLFYGYSENYTIITSGLWFYILFTMYLIKENSKRNLKALIPICIIACCLILSHLVSGYLIFSLIYACYYFSDKGKFIRNSLICTLFSLALLAPIFLYFTFFSEVRFDFTQTHLTNPKFYPISKIISINHFQDILFCIIGSAFLPFVLIIYGFVFFREQVKKLIFRKEIIFLILVLFGFGVHGFVHYPQLGFPADWDLLAFYWTPLSFLSVFIWMEVLNSDNKVLMQKEFIPILIFSIFIFLNNSFYLNKVDPLKMAELKHSLDRIDRFVNSSELEKLRAVKPSYKKFYLQVRFFLFESLEKIEEKNLLEQESSKNLIRANYLFKEELDKNINIVEGKWQKDFYSRMTKYHFEYLELLKVK